MILLSVSMYRNFPGRAKVYWRRILEMKRGKMVTGNYYFANPLESPEYNALWPERTEP